MRTPYSRSAARGLLTDAPQPGDRQRRQERGLRARRHDDEAVGLAQVRRDLGDELGRRDADRRGQPDLGADAALIAAAISCAVPEQRPRSGHVEEGLVDRDRLDERREPPKDRHDLATRALVLAPVDRQEDAVRAERAAVRSGIAEWTPNAPRLVGRGADDAAGRRPAAADDHGLAAELRAVALLDRGEERIEIDVEDRRHRHAAIIAPR